MPNVHESFFRIRAYECDAYGHVNYSNYLRFMQEAAIEASAAVGYDTRRYEEIGKFWLIRESDIAYGSPLHYGDLLTVRTWVADFRRVRSRRLYEFLRAGEPEPVAKASTDWVFLDRTDTRPAAIPREMVLAFAPEGDLPAERREPLPAPEPPAGMHVHRRTVEWRDIDSVGHVNNAVYLSYTEAAGLDAARAYGWDPQNVLNQGWGIFTRRARVEYLAPAQLGDDLEVETWLSPPGNTSITRYYRIRRAGTGELLVRALSVWVTVDLATGRPTPVPESFLQAFRRNMSETA